RGMIPLLPRLPGPAADRLLDHMLSADGFRWSGFDPDTLPDGVRYAPTGGTVVSSARLRELREGIVEVAARHGFPGPATREGSAGFDADVGQWTAVTEELTAGEALRDDVWSFIAVIMAPDVVNWRFGRARERYTG